MTHLKVGIIGGGFVGKIHIEALRRLGTVEVVAVADRDQPAANRIARDWAVPQAWSTRRLPTMSGIASTWRWVTSRPGMPKTGSVGGTALPKVVPLVSDDAPNASTTG